ncbi:hypothetical protein DPMN_129515 [Dreissena polymorpha]|uniref:GIY-YIG domain-containing protein n=1 Tax=Dreissena polymorpha TaxID=45954 RepID=A0A9D4H520_DREPO|nr:hypothetical protein DPMN_129515 [Dreissena polymorpha]
MVYVGETSRSLKERAKEHEADVRLRKEKPISEHFNGAGHRVQDMGHMTLSKHDVNNECNVFLQKPY